MRKIARLLKKNTGKIAAAAVAVAVGAQSTMAQTADGGGFPTFTSSITSLETLGAVAAALGVAIFLFTKGRSITSKVAK